jgi:hypothetical protein
MAVKLSPRLRRVKDFGGIRLATTGLPMAFAAEVAALSSAPQAKQTEWLSSRFLEVVPRCVFVVQGNAPTPATATGLEPVDASDLDMDSVTELFLFVCGLGDGSAPLVPSADPVSAEPSI